MLDFYNIARQEIGIVEVRGEMKHNDRIIEYLKTCYNDLELEPDERGNLGIWGASRDETAWCSAFCNWTVIQAGIPKEHACNDARAIAWLEWGIEIAQPQRGCVAVVRRKRRGADASTGSSSGNHVAIFDKVMPVNRIRLLGGNQSNSVCFKTFSLSKYEILGYRAPRPEYWQAPTAA